MDITDIPEKRLGLTEALVNFDPLNFEYDTYFADSSDIEEDGTKKTVWY